MFLLCYVGCSFTCLTLAPGVQVHCREGKNLVSMDWNGKSDPYLVVKLGPYSSKSSIKYKTLSPSWSESFFLYYHPDIVGVMTALEVECW